MVTYMKMPMMSSQTGITVYILQKFPGKLAATNRTKGTATSRFKFTTF
jgi:hypothetical protein